MKLTEVASCGSEMEEPAKVKSKATAARDTDRARTKRITAGAAKRGGKPVRFHSAENEEEAVRARDADRARTKRITAGAAKRGGKPVRFDGKQVNEGKKDDSENVKQRDEKELTDILHKLDKVTDVEEAKKAAHTFLDKCRFAAEKVARLKRDVDAAPSSTKIKTLCWNTLLAGEGMRVKK